MSQNRVQLAHLTTKLTAVKPIEAFVNKFISLDQDINVTVIQS